MEIDRAKLYSLIVEHFDFEDFRILCQSIGVDFDSLPGESKSSKVRELIAYLERQGRLSDLVEAINTHRPNLATPIFTSEIKAPGTELETLNIELSALRQQLVEVQKTSLTKDELEHQVNTMLQTTNRALGRSEELKAKIILPPPETTDVTLFPSTYLDRLEEYRSDANVAYLLIGMFGGAILGVLSNWATNENFIVSRFSIVLIALLAVLAIICSLWAYRIHRRVNIAKYQMLHSNISSNESIS